MPSNPTNQGAMTQAHTPGPWRVHAYNDGHLLGYIQGAPLDGERYGDAVVLKLAKPTSERSHANARLIAAAPELLEALILARKMLRTLDIDSDVISKALAKAGAA